ncbi:MAG: hypothetical protein AB1742_11810 [bacterium]
MKRNAIAALAAAVLLAAAFPCAGTEFMAPDEVKPGMKGKGLSVFRGTAAEEFGVEILGVLKKRIAGIDLILARLSGMGLEESGTVAGMSGSPVYVDGKMIGAVAYAWGFQKEPICGITPITEMLKVLDGGDGGTGGGFPGGADARGQGSGSGAAELAPIPTPVSLGGFTAAGESRMREALAPFGMFPVRLGGEAGAGAAQYGDAGDLQPGSAVSVPLVTGDLYMGAVGTVTYREGDRVLALGHSFFNMGPVELPMGGAVVHSVMPSYSRSFKLASPTPPVGALIADRLAAVMGVFGVKVPMIPARLTVKSPDMKEPETLNIEVVRNDLLSAWLLYGAAYDAFARSVGELGEATVSVTVRGSIEEHPAPFVFRDAYFYIGEVFFVDVLEHLTTLAFNRFRKVRIKDLEVEVKAERAIKLATVEGLTASGRMFHPGDTVELNVRLLRYDGGERVEKLSIEIPRDAAPGAVTVTVTGGEGLGYPSKVPPADFEQFYSRMNEWIPADTIQAKLVFAGKTPGVEGEELRDLPGSVEQVLMLGGADTVKMVENSVEKLFPQDEIIRGAAKIQIVIEKEFGQ